MRQASSNTQTATYEVTPREAAAALDIELWPESAVTAKLKNGSLVFTVQTIRNTSPSERQAYNG